MTQDLSTKGADRHLRSSTSVRLPEGLRAVADARRSEFGLTLNKYIIRLIERDCGLPSSGKRTRKELRRRIPATDVERIRHHLITLASHHATEFPPQWPWHRYLGLIEKRIRESKPGTGLIARLDVGGRFTGEIMLAASQRDHLNVLHRALRLHREVMLNGPKRERLLYLTKVWIAIYPACKDILVGTFEKEKIESFGSGQWYQLQKMAVMVIIAHHKVEQMLETEEMELVLRFLGTRGGLPKMMPYGAVEFLQDLSEIEVQSLEGKFPWVRDALDELQLQDVRLSQEKLHKVSRKTTLL